MALYTFYLVTYLPHIAVFRKVCFYAGITNPIITITSDCRRSYANTEIVVKRIYFSLIVFPIITFLYYNVISFILTLN